MRDERGLPLVVDLVAHQRGYGLQRGSGEWI
jgi:hypothetical protein